MSKKYIFLGLLILLDSGTAFVYAVEGNWKMATCWMAAATLKAAVTF